MKRFYTDVAVAETDLDWIVQLDGRPIKTQGGRPQVVPYESLAEMLAEEWRGQGEKLDPTSFKARDLTDYAIDVIAREPEAAVAKLLSYGETDTLCYRADPDEPLWKRQREVWEPLVTAMEAREGVSIERISGVMHKAQPAATRERLQEKLEGFDPFTLAALETMASLTASLCVGLAALERDADADALWDAASLEEDWQAELWGRDAEAEQRRAERRSAFLHAIDFAKAARG